MPRLVIRLTDGRVLQTRLKQGLNTLGRNPSADIPIPDSTISLNHCEIELVEDQLYVRDLNSTNGTYIDGRPVQESKMTAGQILQVGDVQIEVDLKSPDPEKSGFIRAEPPRSGLSLQQTSWRTQAQAHADRSTTTLPMARRRTAPAAATPAPVLADAHCCYHPRVQARHQCPSCGQYYCDLCVGTTASNVESVALCRQCGTPCSRVTSPQKQRARTAAKGFFGQVPDAFAYPIRGDGWIILIGVTLFLTLLQMLPIGFLGLILALVAIGYMFSFMQGIIHSTAVGDDRMPDAPGLDDLVSGCLELVGTLVISFLPAIALEIAQALEKPVPDWVVTLAYIGGCAYFPMAFLVVAIKDTVLAAIPTEVLPAIARTWRSYFPMTVLVLLVYFSGIIMGDLSSDVTAISFTKGSIAQIAAMFALFLFWHFITLYLLTVNMRVLGLFYRTHQNQLGWFRR